MQVFECPQKYVIACGRNIPTSVCEAAQVQGRITRTTFPDATS